MYRPASGFNAYPDGGIPKYLRDRNIIGVFDPATGRVNIVHARENTEWQHGQGEFNIHDFKGRLAVITESGQRRSDYISDGHFYFLDLSTRNLALLPIGKDLAARGRDIGSFYLLDTRGTLLFVTPPRGARKTGIETNELWLRRPSGEYVLLAKASDYYGQSGGEVFYWSLENRTMHAYDVATGSIRVVPRYAGSSDPRPSVSVGMSTDHKALELSRRYGDTWRTERVLLILDKAK